MTLEQALANWQERVAILKATRVEAMPLATVRDLLVEIAVAGEPFTHWLSEDEARLKSARSVKWLRGQFAAWATQGLAKQVGPRRYYLDVIVPQRVHLSAVRAEARDLARKAS